MFCRRYLLVSAALLTAAVPAAAEVLVVRSTGPSAATYPVRQRLPDNQRIILVAGDRVVLLSEGGTRTLAGPGNFQAAPLLRTLATRRQTARRYAAILARGTTRASVAATRREPPGPLPTGTQGLWSFPLGMSGTVCTPDPAQMFLTRPPGGAAVTVRLARASEPTVRHDIPLAANALDAAWGGYAISDGTEFLVTTMPASGTQRVRFAVTGPLPTALPALAGLLADRGCTEQLDRLLALIPAQP